LTFLQRIDDMSTHSQRVGHDRNHRVEAEAGRHEARIYYENIVGAMQTAEAIDHGGRGIVAHPAGTH